MILIDTNVISEPLRRDPEPRVIEWIDAQALETLYLSAITVAELRVTAMPSGKRRDRLRTSLETRVLPRFAGRVLGFDMEASAEYAELMAAAHHMMVATRDTAPFTAAGLGVINPWVE